MKDTVTVSNLIGGLKEKDLSHGEPVHIILSPGNVQHLVNDHEELAADREAQTKEAVESFKHLKTSIEAAQSVVDILQSRHRELTGQDHWWLR